MKKPILLLCLLVGTNVVAQKGAMAPVSLVSAADNDFWNEKEKEIPKVRGAQNPVPVPNAPVDVEMLESQGPGIHVINPKTVGVRVPVELTVQFVKRSSPPDPASIQVSAKKWMMNKFRFERDITDRVRPFASAEGIHIPEADLPTGRYQIILRVSDTEKNRTAGQMVLEILPK